MERNHLTPSQKAFDILKKFEGCRLKAYSDLGGIWTIGYGATGPSIKANTIWTQEQAETDLLCRIEIFGRIISYHVKVSLTQNQFDALISLTYNIGAEAFRKSTLMRFLNEKNYLAAADEFPKWNKVKGRIVEGLTLRRREEMRLFLS